LKVDLSIAKKISRAVLGVTAIVYSSFSSYAWSQEASVFLNPFSPSGTGERYVENQSRMSLDENGVLIFDYGSAFGGAGKVHNTTFIATYALSLFEDYLISSDPKHLDQLNRQVDFLLANYEERDYHGAKFWVWSLPFPNDKYKAPAGWISALAQGRILSLFAQMYKLTGKQIHAEAAEKAYNAFLVPMTQGGVTTYDNGVHWLEEVASNDIPSGKILNGHISAVGGIWTYAKNLDLPHAMEFAKRAAQAVSRDIETFDAKFLSYYSLYPNEPYIYAPKSNYNFFHIRQLVWLRNLVEDDNLLEHALQFSMYDEQRWTLSAKQAISEDHLPTNMVFTRTAYWADKDFPTWVQIDLGYEADVSSASLLARGSDAAYYPRDVEVQVSLDGVNWENAASVSGNNKDALTIAFAAKKARYIRANILSNNGAQTVALDGFSVERFPTPPRAFASLHHSTTSNRPHRMFSTYWRMPENGMFTADLGNFSFPGDKAEFVYISQETPGTVKAYAGANLSELSEVEVTTSEENGRVTYSYDVQGKRYIKMAFSDFPYGQLLRVKCVLEKNCDE